MLVLKRSLVVGVWDNHETTIKGSLADRPRHIESLPERRSQACTRLWVPIWLLWEGPIRPLFRKIEIFEKSKKHQNISTFFFDLIESGSFLLGPPCSPLCAPTVRFYPLSMRSPRKSSSDFHRTSCYAGYGSPWPSLGSLGASDSEEAIARIWVWNRIF